MKNATIRKIEQTAEGKILITVDCPYCNKKHTHGGGNINSPLSLEEMTKLSHCVKRDCDTYKLILT
jgi:hypothetical protein